MTGEEFTRILYNQPFKPFDLFMPDGYRVPVRHRECVEVRGRTVEVKHPSSEVDVVDLMLVARIQKTEPRMVGS